MYYFDQVKIRDQKHRLSLHIITTYYLSKWAQNIIKANEIFWIQYRFSCFIIAKSFLLGKNNWKWQEEQEEDPEVGYFFKVKFILLGILYEHCMVLLSKSISPNLSITRVLRTLIFVRSLGWLWDFSSISLYLGDLGMSWDFFIKACKFFKLTILISYLLNNQKVSGKSLMHPWNEVYGCSKKCLQLSCCLAACYFCKFCRCH